MKAYTKLTLLLLVIVMIINIYGCGKSSNTDDINKSILNETTVEERQVDFGGKTIEIAFPAQARQYTDDEHNKIIADIENMYNCKLQFKKIDDQIYYQNKIIEEILSGTFESQIVYFDSNFSLVQLYKNKVIYPLDEYISFDDDYLNKRFYNRSLWQGNHYGLSVMSYVPVSNRIS